MKLIKYKRFQNVRICTTLTESKEKILKRWLSLCADNLVSLQTYIQELGIPKGNVLFCSEPLITLCVRSKRLALN